jgi:hypothetical protein
MPIKTSDLEKMLLSKCGFESDTTKSVDHKWFILQIDGLPPITTKISHGAKEISKDLESKIAKQLHVKRAFLIELIKCTKSKEAYFEQLKTDPYPPFNPI